jgi:hypothetical protein
MYSPFFTSKLNVNETLVSRPHRFTAWKSASGTSWIEGWIGLRAKLDAAEKRKISCPCRGSNSLRQARNLSLYRLSYAGSPYCN